MINRIKPVVVGCLVSIACASCASGPMAKPQPTQLNPGKDFQKYDNPSAGISFVYPSSWKSANTSPTQVQFTATDGASMQLDVPKLPWHPYGLIPIDRVRDGYIDDAKKRMPDIQVTQLPDPTVPDAKQHRVKLVGHDQGKPVIEEAATFVRGDTVFVLTIDCNEKTYSAMHSSLDAVLQSIRWTK